MKLLLFFISDISFISSFSNTFFRIFSPSSWKSNRHVCQRWRRMQRKMNPCNWWKSWCANRNKQPSTLFFIRKFRKVVGHLNKGENDKFTKAIFFFLRGDPYSKAKTITSGRRCNLDDGEGSRILKLVGHQSLSTYCKINLSEWKKFKTKKI